MFNRKICPRGSDFEKIEIGIRIALRFMRVIWEDNDGIYREDSTQHCPETRVRAYHVECRWLSDIDGDDA